MLSTELELAIDVLRRSERIFELTGSRLLLPTQVNHNTDYDFFTAYSSEAYYELIEEGFRQNKSTYKDADCKYVLTRENVDVQLRLYPDEFRRKQNVLLSMHEGLRIRLIGKHLSHNEICNSWDLL